MVLDDTFKPATPLTNVFNCGSFPISQYMGVVMKLGGILFGTHCTDMKHSLVFGGIFQDLELRCQPNIGVPSPFPSLP